MMRARRVLSRHGLLMCGSLTMAFTAPMILPAQASGPAKVSMDPRAADSARVAIAAILKTHEVQWNKHDMNAWAEILHDDADWVHWRGGYWHGKAAIKAGHEQIHRTYYKATILSPQRIEDLTFLAPDMVLVHARGSLSGDERSPGQTFQYRKTILFTRQNGVWRIRALHNTRLDGVD